MTAFSFLMPVSASREVCFNVSFSFENDDVNQLRCSAVLIEYKNSFFLKVFKNVKIKKKYFQSLF